MLRLLIAEDDKETREGLCDCIQWHEYGIELVKTVSNGVEAMEYLEKENGNIDILLTDIKMPLMDGVQLVQKLRKKYSKVRAIIITAYWEKEYLKAAFEFDVTDYILKPVKLSELDKVLRKVCDECNMEKARSQRHAQLEQKLVESMPALRQRMIKDLLKGRMKGEAHINNWMVFAEFPFGFHDWFTILCTDYSDETEEHGSSGVFAKDSRIFDACNSIKHLFGECFTFYSLRMDESEYVFVLSSRIPLGMEGQKTASSEIQKILHCLSGKKVTVGVSREIKGIDNIYISYHEAVHAFEYRFFAGDNRVIHIDDINYHQPSETFHPIHLQDNLIKQVRLGHCEQALICTEKLFEYIKKLEGVSIEFVRSIYLEVAVDINKQLLDVIPDVDLYKNDFIWKEVFQLWTLDAMQDWLRTTVKSITQAINEHMNNSHNNSIVKIKDIISKSYMEDITIQIIADQMYMTPNYLSLLFKKNTGQTINGYITKVRMEKAMELLRDPSVRISEVSQLVGYKDSDYFSKVFKRFTGMNPSEYKEKSFK